MVKHIVKGKAEKKPAVSKYVTVSWKWNNTTQGLVEWSFTNNSTSTQSVILYRNGYYFGNAFWCIYEANSEFNTAFMQGDIPTGYPDNGVENNSPDLGIVKMSNGKPLVAFVFMISPKATWSMLEGGFVEGMMPEDAQIYDAVFNGVSDWCVGYDSAQVTAWDEQANDKLQGYSPNPSTFNVTSVSVDAPFITLYNDPISKGVCTTATTTSSCVKKLTQGLETGNFVEFFEGLLCLLTDGNTALISKKELNDVLDTVSVELEKEIAQLKDVKLK